MNVKTIDFDSSVRIIQGHALEVLRTLPDNIAQMCVTSPPYWGLRDYGTEPVEWGDGQYSLGLEPTPELYVEHLVEIFREVHRVLKNDGVLWLNLGDSYWARRSHPGTMAGDGG